MACSGAYPPRPTHIDTTTSKEHWSGVRVKGNIEERAVKLAEYIIEHKTTVRAAARQFGISKSTVHKDIRERLPTINRALFLQAKAVLEENKAERHIRGGIATRKKYRGE